MAMLRRKTLQTNLHSRVRIKDSARNVRAWLSLLGALYAAILFAGLIAPYAPNEQNRNLPFASPPRLHFVDTSGRAHVRPFMYRLVRRSGSPGSFDEYEEDRSRRYPVHLLVRGAHYRIAG